MQSPTTYPTRRLGTEAKDPDHAEGTCKLVGEYRLPTGESTRYWQRPPCSPPIADASSSWTNAGNELAEQEQRVV